MGADRQWGQIKVSRGSLPFILTRGIGRAFVERNVDADAVHSFLAQELLGAARDG